MRRYTEKKWSNEESVAIIETVLATRVSNARCSCHGDEYYRYYRYLKSSIMSCRSSGANN
jgi:hypothetical protein